MEDEFDRIIQFFDLDEEERESKLTEIFEDSLECFDRFQHVMLHGTPEQKKKAVEKVMILKSKVEKETRNICAKTGLTPDQLAAYAEDPENFPLDQQEIIKNAKDKLNSSLQKTKKIVQEKSREGVDTKSSSSSSGGGQHKKPSKKDEDSFKRHRHPKHWIPS